MFILEKFKLIRESYLILYSQETGFDVQAVGQHIKSNFKSILNETEYPTSRIIGIGYSLDSAFETMESLKLIMDVSTEEQEESEEETP